MSEGLDSFAGNSRLLLRDGILGLFDGLGVEGPGSRWHNVRGCHS